MLKFPDSFIENASVNDCMAHLEDWSIKYIDDSQSCLYRSLEFKNFLDCIRFMDLLAPMIESLDHHPTWTNSHSNLYIELTTWDEGKNVGLKDFKLAFVIDYHFNRFY